MSAVHHHRKRPRLVAALTLVAGVIATLVAIVPATPASSAMASPWLLGAADSLDRLPTSGTGWTKVVSTANEPIVVNLADQDNKGDVVALAAGLVYARTGDAAYRTKVESALAKVPGTEAGGRTLSLGRQLAGWVLAADLVDYRAPAFMDWLSQVRTKDIGGHGRWYTLTQTHEDTSNNWGAFAGASRLAASRYLGDTQDVQRAAAVFRGWLGDASAYDSFRTTADFDSSWACGYPTWDPVNSSSCGDRSGALVEDISRGEAYPNATSTGLSYSWEALQGAVLQALLLEHAGYTDVWEWEDRALLRAVTFMRQRGGFDGSNFNAINHWIPFVIDQAYGTSFASGAAGTGRQFGFTDWLKVAKVGSTPTSTVAPTTSTTAAPAPTTTAAPATTTTTAPATTTTTAAPATTTTTASATTTTTAPAQTGELTADATQSTARRGSSGWIATLTVNVARDGSPVAGAQVLVDWRGSSRSSGTVSCETDATGSCAARVQPASKDSYVRLTVDSVEIAQQRISPRSGSWQVPQPG